MYVGVAYKFKNNNDHTWISTFLLFILVGKPLN